MRAKATNAAHSPCRLLSLHDPDNELSGRPAEHHGHPAAVSRPVRGFNRTVLYVAEPAITLATIDPPRGIGTDVEEETRE
jgi:hypothetical protein